MERYFDHAKSLRCPLILFGSGKGPAIVKALDIWVLFHLKPIFRSRKISDLTSR
jgi:hypothetical protein